MSDRCHLEKNATLAATSWRLTPVRQHNKVARHGHLEQHSAALVGHGDMVAQIQTTKSDAFCGHGAGFVSGFGESGAGIGHLSTLFVHGVNVVVQMEVKPHSD